MTTDVNIQKKLLRINDTTLPLDLILKAIGKGNAIKIKIIDKPEHPKPQSLTPCKNVVELIEEDAPEETSVDFSKDDNSGGDNSGAGTTEEG